MRVAGLVREGLDTSALENWIETVEQMVANIDDYRPSTVVGLEDKLNDAKDVLANATTQAEIDEATKTLREARLSARTKADTSALEALIAEVNAMDLSKYTDASVSGLRTALFQRSRSSRMKKLRKQMSMTTLRMLMRQVSGDSTKSQHAGWRTGDTACAAA